MYTFSAIQTPQPWKHKLEKKKHYIKLRPVQSRNVLHSTMQKLLQSRRLYLLVLTNGVWNPFYHVVYWGGEETKPGPAMTHYDGFISQNIWKGVNITIPIIKFYHRNFEIKFSNKLDLWNPYVGRKSATFLYIFTLDLETTFFQIKIYTKHYSTKTIGITIWKA